QRRTSVQFGRSPICVESLHPAGESATRLRHLARLQLDLDEVVQVSQVDAGLLPNGIPSYSVTITNTCLDCTVRDVHVSCGEFASTELVDPSSFQRLAYGDCLVRDGGPIGPGETVSFEYSNSLIYSMDVASVSCGDI
uniref:TPD1 protein n=1 Tax=Setaria italica TaxID=4555 RepID=K4AMF4_SETIT